ncbi:MAG TPA: winged helix-turn-helix domain-containing protein, partial [Polyangiales bacterium]|nr:winged helix-turn-helix domain-containing protein [Polyangiales bacterium]
MQVQQSVGVGHICEDMAAYAFDDFIFDDIRYQLTRGGTQLKADTQVLELLSYLLKNPGRVVSKEELIEQIWQGRTLGDNVI